MAGRFVCLKQKSFLGLKNSRVSGDIQDDMEQPAEFSDKLKHTPPFLAFWVTNLNKLHQTAGPDDAGIIRILKVAEPSFSPTCKKFQSPFSAPKKTKFDKTRPEISKTREALMF